MNSFNHFSIAAVIVTHNRFQLLKECISSLKNQSKKLEEIIIVNNSSTDGTSEWLESQSDLTIINQNNLGSSGGQYAGIMYAYEKGFEWIWVMDDDTRCTENSLDILIAFIQNHKDSSNIGFLYPKVKWNDNTLHEMNLPGNFHKKRRWEFIGEENINLDYCRIDVASFVGLLVNRKAIEKYGLPNKEMFIWFDDIEYTARFIDSENYFVSNSEVFHNTHQNRSSNLFDYGDTISLKQAYGIRNFSFLYWRYNKSYLLMSAIKGIIINIWRNKKLNFNTLLKSIKLVRRGIKSDLSQLTY